MPLDTNLNVSPFFDDFYAANGAQNNNYHRILFRPSVAIQARELTQLQTILQNQVERFGDSIFVEGTIIKGCNFLYDNQYYYAKISDTRIDGEPTNPDQYVNTRVVCPASNLQAIVVNSVQGLQSQAPDLNTIFIKYINSGNGQSQFSPTDTLNFYTNTNPNDTASIVTAYSVTIVNNSISGNSSSPAVGTGYSFRVTDGIVFQKGFFIDVANSTSVVVSKYSNAPNNVVVGFDIQENIINELQDNSLYDNAAGFTNQNAPGAERLQLIPTLVVANTDALPSNNFFSLVEWQNGSIVRSSQQTEYSSLGRELARRTYEESGNYVVNPFSLSTESIVGNTTSLNLVTSSGLAYVDGYRVELLNNLRIPVRQGNDTRTVSNQTLSVSYGNYVLVQEFVGNFASNIGATISLRDTALQALTNNTFTPISAGSEIGQAKLLAVELISGIAGTYNAQYALYLGDITMNSGQNFASVKSIYYSGATSGAADTVLVGGLATLNETNFSSLVFDTTKIALKTLRNNSINNNQYIYRTISTGVTIANTGVMGSINKSGSEQFAYGSGSLDSIVKQNILVIPTTSANVVNTGISGTVTASNTAGNTQVVGSSTLFTTTYAIGDYINVNGQPRQVVSISNNTLLNVNAPFTGAQPTSNTHNKYYPAYVPIPIASRPTKVNIASSNSMTITLVSANGAQETLSSALTGTIVHYDVRVSSAPEISKKVNNNIVVLFDTAYNNPGSGTLSCNLTSNTVTGTNTFFQRDVYPGYTLKLANGSSVGTVNSVISNTSLTLSTSNAAIAATTNAYTYTAVNVSNTTGPWVLGVPDAYKINAVYKGITFANTLVSGVTDSTTLFSLDSGQRDAVYDLSTINLRPGSGGFVKSGDKISVVFNAFTSTTGTGHGYFSVDSYPIDDANTANTSAIQTIQIPRYTSTTGQILDLRDAIDFRPVVKNTAVYATTVATASINPQNTQTFSGSELYIATPNQLFKYDSQYYLGRIDKLIINSLGSFLVQEGISSENPINNSNGSITSMALGTIVVPAYPSLSVLDALNTGRTDHQVKATTSQNRRYTMKDIGKIDSRVANLEYYAALSLLESQTTALAIKSGANTFINRFKNGIFVDQYNDFTLLNTTDPEFSIALDPVESAIIPRFDQRNIKLKFVSQTSSNTIVQTNSTLSLAYSNNLLFSQSSATQQRNVAESVWNWQGVAYCFPSYDSFIDTRVQIPPTPIVNYVPNTTTQVVQVVESSTGVVTPPAAPTPVPQPQPNQIQGRLKLDFYTGYESSTPLAPGSDTYYTPYSGYFLGSVYTSTPFFNTADTASYFNSLYNTAVSIPHSCVYTGWIVFPTTDTYAISGYSDDGMEVYINGQQMFGGNGWNLGNGLTPPNGHSDPIGPSNFSATAGTFYPITIYYFNAIALGHMSLSWNDSSNLYSGTIPMSAFYSDNIALPALSQADTVQYLYNTALSEQYGPDYAYYAAMGLI